MSTIAVFIMTGFCLFNAAAGWLSSLETETPWLIWFYNLTFANVNLFTALGFSVNVLIPKQIIGHDMVKVILIYLPLATLLPLMINTPANCALYSCIYYVWSRFIARTTFCVCALFLTVIAWLGRWLKKEIAGQVVDQTIVWPLAEVSARTVRSRTADSVEPTPTAVPADARA